MTEDADSGVDARTPAPPGAAGRRRRRWKIVAIVLLVCVCQWSRLGRIDSRLIGAWKNERPDALPADCRFGADGYSRWTVAYISVPMVSTYRWAVHGDELRLSNPRSFELKLSWIAWRRNANLLVEQLTGEAVSDRFRILEITGDRLKLKRETPWGSSPDGVETYVRVE